MMSATLHQLEVFETVARHGSFTRAAEELSITQPTVSGQVKQLSQTVGMPLFEQIGKRLYLTEAGSALLTTCREIFSNLDNFQMKVADLQGMKQGKLRLGVVTTAKYFIPRLLGSFCQKYPEIDVALVVTNHQTLRERMQDNADDLYVLSQPPEDTDLHSQAFLDNPLVVVAKKGHPLSGKSKVPIKSLSNEAFIMRESGSGTRRAVQQLFAKHKVNVSVKLELGSNEAIKQAIAGGLGISVLSANCLIPEGTMAELTVLDVQHFPIQCSWYVAYLGGKQLSVIADTFRKYLLDKSNHIPVPTAATNGSRSVVELINSKRKKS
ncbi:MAG: LysR substrate-binding domain-containing protein [Oscillatoria sp. PMC 1051.18]|nr:LysR substrate-binding domain-containing protein [Oscillatoria sp. PMC 1050.18]MEC5031260.1 LysR substrate-binding domain-containing protein [Oscillatoria sp. PMC 1051.18]